MTLFDHDAESWQDPAFPVIGGVRYDRSPKVRIVIHYPGGHGPASLADVPAYLRAAQHAYLTDPDRGYSIGYNAAVAFGQAWELRGRRWQCAANAVTGMPDANPGTFAIIMLVEGAAGASPESAARARDLIADIDELDNLTGRPFPVLGHGDLEPTACPGAGIRAQMFAGMFNPDEDHTPPITVPPLEDDIEMDTARLIRFRGFTNVFLIGAGTPIHMTGELVADYQTRSGVPALLIEPHPDLQRQMMAATNLGQLTPGGPEDKF